MIRRETGKIQEANIGALCVEVRPHPDFGGERWWHDMDIVLDEHTLLGVTAARVLWGDTISWEIIPLDGFVQNGQLLVAYYEDRDNSEIVSFMRSKCWQTF